MSSGFLLHAWLFLSCSPDHCHVSGEDHERQISLINVPVRSLAPKISTPNKKTNASFDSDQGSIVRPMAEVAGSLGRASLA